MPLIFDREHYEQVIEQGVLKAREFLWIATANLKDLHVIHQGHADSLLDYLSRLAGSGVVIRLLHGAEPSRPFQQSFDKHPDLIAGAMEMQPCRRLHAKIVVVDGVMAYVGSANLTGAGLGAKSAGKRNFEVGYLTREPAEVAAVADYFDSLWMGLRCGNCMLRTECEDPMA